VGNPPLSIRIEPTGLADRLVGRRFAYLVTTGRERAHVVALRCEVESDRVRVIAPGRSACANVATNPHVTLVWIPTTNEVEFHDYSIVADGSASIQGEDIEIAVTNAVFHRPAP